MKSTSRSADSKTATDSGTATDSETATDLEVATARDRVAAYLADAAVVGPAIGIAGGVVGGRLGDSRRERVRLVGLLGLAIANLYHIVLEGTGGQTVGKRVVGIRVVSGDGGPATYRAAAIRTLFRFADWLPIGYLLGFASMALTDRRQRLGDLAADTVVVRTGDGDGEKDG